MATIKIPCPCGKTVEVPESWAGKSGKCMACGRLISVPQPPSPQVMQPRISSKPAQSSQGVTRRRDLPHRLRVTRRLEVIAGIVGICAIVAVFLGFFLVTVIREHERAEYERNILRNQECLALKGSGDRRLKAGDASGALKDYRQALA